MTTYSVTDAKAGFSRLIDRALDGEDVVITRYGKPVVELRAIPTPQVGQTTYKWLCEALGPQERRAHVGGAATAGL